MADAEEKILKTYSVTIPIAGHVIVEVDAEDEKSAIEKAFKVEISLAEDLGQWQTLDRFHQGNVCYCPRPWEASAEEV
jgi:hypothetical protein